MMNYGSLTSTEVKLSKETSARLGFKVLIYRDGNWICQPFSELLNGYGSTAEEAENDCKERNNVR